MTVAEPTWVDPRHSRRPGSEEPADAHEAIERLCEDLYPELWANLTPHGRETFVDEMVGAFESGSSPSDVAEGWERTLAFRQQPDYDAAMEQAGRSPTDLGERTYTSEEIRARLTR